MLQERFGHPDPALKDAATSKPQCYCAIIAARVASAHTSRVIRHPIAHPAAACASLSATACAGSTNSLLFVLSLRFDPLTAMGFLVAAQKAYSHMRLQQDSVRAATDSILASAGLATPWTSQKAATTVSSAASAPELQCMQPAQSVANSSREASDGRQQQEKDTTQQLVQQLQSVRLAAAVLSCRELLSHNCTSVKGSDADSTSSGTPCLAAVAHIDASSSNANCCCPACWCSAVYLLHTVLLGVLPLQLRAQPAVELAAAGATLATPAGTANNGSSNGRQSQGAPEPMLAACVQALLQATAHNLAELVNSRNCDSSSGNGSGSGSNASAWWRTAGREVADPWDGHLLLQLFLQLALAAAPAASAAQPHSSKGAGPSSKPGKPEPAAGTLTGLPAGVQQALAAALASMVQLPAGDNKPVCNACTSSINSCSTAADSSSSSSDAHAAALVAKLQQVLLAAVPEEVLLWMRLLPQPGPAASIHLATQTAPAAIFSIEAGLEHGAQVLANMKKRNKLLAAMVAGFENRACQHAPLPLPAAAASDATAAGVVSPDQEGADGESGSSSSSLPLTGRLFGVSVYEEKWHWHLRKELEPAFFWMVSNTTVLRSTG